MRKSPNIDIIDCRIKIDDLLHEWNCEIQFDDKLNEVILVDLDTKEFQYITDKREL